MLMVVITIASIVSIVTTIWSLVIIFKRSVLGGLLSLFFGLPILYYLVTGWGKEGEDIKLPFFLNIVVWAVAFAVVFAAIPKMPTETDLAPSFGTSSRSSPGFREPSPSSGGGRFTETSNTQPLEAPRPSSRPPEPMRPPESMRPRLPQTEVAREVVKEAPRRPRPAHSDCVYKPVMTDEDMAKCR